MEATTCTRSESRGDRDVRTQQESREMGDVDLRIRHMDALGIAVQVLHNTIFIESVSDRPEVEVALCRVWNRWMAEVWRLGQGRLRWVCVPPFQSLPDALDEIRFGKAQGAVGVQLPPFAGHRLMTDPYFYPLFEEAERLDLPIASHIANATPLDGGPLSGHVPGEQLRRRSLPRLFSAVGDRHPGAPDQSHSRAFPQVTVGHH